MKGGMDVINVGETVVQLWCILARQLRARNLRNDKVLITDYGIRDIRPSPRVVRPKETRFCGAHLVPVAALICMQGAVNAMHVYKNTVSACLSVRLGR
jgi:hypothetical protein